MAAELEFITGRAGSGRTRALYERVARVRAAGGRCYVIVEDQATFETERMLAELLGGGLYDCTVCSWVSLARRVLDSAGDRRAYLSPQGKLMLTRRAVDLCAPKLKIFAGSARFKGFPKECETLMGRFKSCAVTPEALSEAASRLVPDDPLALKLNDIALIYAECEKLMRERYLDSGDMMNSLCDMLPETELAGAYVFIDGGSAMNEQCCRVFARMLLSCAGVYVTLYGGADRDQRLFEPETQMLERLAEIASDTGVGYKLTSLPPRSEGRSAALIHLERELFAHPHRVFEGVPEGMGCYAAKDRFDETAEAAERIRAAAASGMRYRDMAVAVSDLAAYAPVVARVFKAYGIPYFTDAKRSAGAYPASELILAALSAVQHGFDADSVLRVLKTGYCAATREQAEVFENYLIATGFFGKKLTEPFANAPEGAEQARQAVMEPLIRFKENVRVGTAAQRARAIYGLLQDMDVYSAQKRLCQSLHEAGEFKQEEENARVLNIITELLDQLYVILGEGEIGLDRFVSVVKEGLNSYDLGVIPTTCDQVLVGDVGRTSFRRVRLMQVLGMNEGLFPPRRTNDGVIDDNDLRAMQGLGLTVWHTADRLCRKDELDIYSALSKPTESLYFSFAVNQGGELSPACAMLSVINDIFPDIKKENGVTERRLRGSRDMALKELALGMRRMADTGESEPGTAGLYAYFGGKPETAGTLNAVERECFGYSSPEPFGGDAAARLYGGSLYGSSSRLETFNRCPFGHFARYGLNARERVEHKEKNTDVGLFFHAAIEAFTKYVIDNGIDWAKLDDEAVFAALRELMPPLMAEYKDGLLYETARNRARLISMMETVRETCCAITRHIARGSFRPIGGEVRFGSEDSVFPPLALRMGNGTTFYLRGTIDRIDAFEERGEDGRVTVHNRIIDYKTGIKKFDLAELGAGMQLQLPLYAAAVAAAYRASGDKELAEAARDSVGMYYMHITSGAAEDAEEAASAEAPQERSASAFSEKLMKLFMLNGISLNEANIMAAVEDFEGSSSVISARHNAGGAYTGAGLVDRREYEKVIDDAMRIAAGTLESIMQGHAEVSPARRSGGKSACDYCPYGDVCRFDPDPGTDKFRMIKSVSADRYFGREK